MIQVKRKKATPRYVPDYIAKSLLDVNFEELKSRGIKFVAFDADSTLVPFQGIKLTSETREFLKQKRKLFKKWCIASNRVPDNLRPLAKGIDAEVIRATFFVRKPHRKYFSKVLNHLDAQPHEVAMIGDKLFADMFGAKRSGFITVWVERLGTDPLDRLIYLRRVERRLLKNYVQSGKQA